MEPHEHRLTQLESREVALAKRCASLETHVRTLIHRVADLEAKDELMRQRAIRLGDRMQALERQLAQANIDRTQDVITEPIRRKALELWGKTMQEQQYGPCHSCGESTEADRLRWETGYPLCQDCINGHPGAK